MTIERIDPTCNLDTVKDGRGAIFTFIPKDPIMEFNLNIVKAGKVRGNHHHPEFDAVSYTHLTLPTTPYV